MTFDIKWKPKTFKVLKKLPQKISKRIWDKVWSIKSNPFRYLEHYEGESLYKLRVGDYRALIDVDFDKKLLIVQVLDKRGRVYKK